MDSFQAWTLGLAALSVVSSAATALGAQWFQDRRERRNLRERDRERWIDERRALYGQYFAHRERVANSKAIVARLTATDADREALDRALEERGEAIGALWFIGSDNAFDAIVEHDTALYEAVGIARRLSVLPKGPERDALWEDYRAANHAEGEAWLALRQITRAEVRADVS